MSHIKSEVLFAFEPPPRVREKLWEIFAELEAAGRPISERTMKWKLLWEGLWAGEKVEVVDEAPPAVWVELFKTIEELEEVMP